MSNLIPNLRIVKGIPRVISTEIATFFEREHKNVLRDIREIMANCPESFNALNFEPVKYKDSKGEIREGYYLTRDAFALVAMGFTGPKALKFKLAYIEAFNRMEAELTAKALPAPVSMPPALPGPRNLREKIIYQFRMNGGEADLRVFYRHINRCSAKTAMAEIIKMKEEGLVQEKFSRAKNGRLLRRYRLITPGLPEPGMRPLPHFDPAIMSQLESAHPQDRPYDYSDIKYCELTEAKVKDEDALAELTGNYSVEPSSPEVIELFHFLTRFEDMARAWPDVMKGMVMMERELAHYKLQLAKGQDGRRIISLGAASAAPRQFSSFGSNRGSDAGRRIHSAVFHCAGPWSSTFRKGR